MTNNSTYTSVTILCRGTLEEVPIQFVSYRPTQRDYTDRNVGNRVYRDLWVRCTKLSLK